MCRQHFPRVRPESCRNKRVSKQNHPPQAENTPNSYPPSQGRRRRLPWYHIRAPMRSPCQAFPYQRASPSAYSRSCCAAAAVHPQAQSKPCPASFPSAHETPRSPAAACRFPRLKPHPARRSSHRQSAHIRAASIAASPRPARHAPTASHESARRASRQDAEQS